MESDVVAGRVGRGRENYGERRGGGARGQLAVDTSGLLGTPSPALPVAWPPPCVSDRDDKNARRLIAVEDDVWEPREMNSAHIEECRPAIWRFDDERECAFELLNEPSSDTGVALGVPRRRVFALSDGE